MVLGTEQVLLGELRKQPAGLWSQVWTKIILEAVTARACDLINIPEGTLHSDWEQLDDPRHRRRLVPNTAATRTRCADLILHQADSLNAVLGERGLPKLGKGALRKKLEIILPTLIASPVSEALIRQNLFPGAWSAIADEIARRVWARNALSTREPEWQLTHGLILAGYFASCQLVEARQVPFAFRAASPGLLRLRGTFLRIPEQLSAGGLRDRPVPVCRRRGGIELRHAALSPILEATMAESAAIAGGRGFAHQDALTQQALTGLNPFQRSTDDRDSAFYRLYEETMLIYLTLMSIEQLLRAWASNRGITHVKPGGEPEGVMKWLHRLPCSGKLQSSLKELYDSTRSNIRNRVMHGNLLEIEAKKLEVQLPLIDPGRFGAMKSPANTFLPANISQLCLECLELLDREVAASFQIGERDLDWVAALALTTEEIDFGLCLRSDFRRVEDTAIVREVSQYLHAMFPGIRILFLTGFVGWMHPYQRSLIRFAALGLVFESLYRLTVHLLGFETIQVSVSKDGQLLHCQYKMLDGRPTGICTAAIQEKILATVNAEGRSLAERNLKLAIKARNAFAHGAICTFDVRTADGMGHLFVKAITTLIQAGMYHMVQEAAYHRSANRAEHDHRSDQDNWFAALDEIEELLRTTAARVD